MNILHIGLVSHFTESMLYQDNYLSELNAQDGHNVVFITDVFIYRDGKLIETVECDKVLDNKVRLIRLKYDYIINTFISRKIQKVKKIVKYLNILEPDVILYHGLCGYELMDVARYVKNNRDVLFYIDSHENFNNTAKNIISKLAYKYIHGFFIKKALPYAKKILYIGYPEKKYIKEMYDISEDKLEYFPLGGIIIDKEIQKKYRQEIINDMSFPNDVIICSHSGKIDKLKKTDQVIKAFSNVRDNRFRLLIYGSIQDELKTEINSLIEKDKRIYFLGWKNSNQQERILAATDLYIQPGSASATAQVALCCGCALIVNKEYYLESFRDNVFYADNSKEIEVILYQIASDINVLKNMKEKSYSLATNELDYDKLANRYLHLNEV